MDIQYRLRIYSPRFMSSNWFGDYLAKQHGLLVGMSRFQMLRMK